MSKKPDSQKKGAQPCSSGAPAPGLKRKPGRPRLTVKDVEKAVPDPTGFERNLKAERILGATDYLGRMYFLMKWVGLDNELDLVCAEKAKIACPQVVIDFYERHLTWSLSIDLAEETLDATRRL